ncbi:bifunctional DNA-formamidopyrimidine glycosylase/DNA-(apurinic or apyrimidinic site) lyase [Thiofilum flexile]|uniref:bifunctional DNA-formamidopyrimidine glycosylase/DNA-(apurinic or apyrimidinic site) lyase n=1 Tax=Thiofilum flexile TaxID=125627 RepID=UPI00036045EB|nr:bifunctional DNA-formamidopyrimidine glycosylase/DNA-(apurinic or apyrimidinic site) lyase [Thiofilum flexile]
MPELPEVETTCRGIAPYLQSSQIIAVEVRQPRLRWPVSEQLPQIVGQTIQTIERRAKYILIHTLRGTLMIHLGMSGSLRICTLDTPPRKHDHIDFVLANGKVLRFHDPRRFGAVLWTTEPPAKHPLLAKLGIEPLEAGFTADYLWTRAQGKKVSIKAFIMDAHIVVGVGNIYANEALFLAGINPQTVAGTLAKAAYERLCTYIKQVLTAAITQGGTTLKDFVREEGQSGYFQLALNVYGRKGQPCVQCKTPIVQIKQGQRSSWYCPHCQPL